MQALRADRELEVIRQPTLRISQPDGSWTEVYPDLLLPRRGLIVEVDGGEHLIRFVGALTLCGKTS